MVGKLTRGEGPAVTRRLTQFLFAPRECSGEKRATNPQKPREENSRRFDRLPGRRLKAAFSRPSLSKSRGGGGRFAGDEGNPRA